MKSVLLLCLALALRPFAAGQSHTTNVDDARPGATVSAPRASDRPARVLDLPQLPGWPQTMAVAPLYSPSGVTLADLNGDDTLEVIAGSTDGKLYAWRYTGTLLPNFPVTVGARIMAPPAVADVNNDGVPEIAVTTVAATYLYTAAGTLMPGWPKTLLTNAFGFSAPVLYDIDGNGTLEIIQGSGANTGNLGRIYIWKYDGTPMPGWPQTLGNNYRITSTVAVGDIDGNGSPEIIALAVRAGSDTTKLFAYHSDSTQVQGWPYAVVAMGSSWSAPAIGNIDPASPTLEVAFTAANFFGGNGALHVVNANGTTTTGFPVSLPIAQNYPSIALGDIDRNGNLEIICGGTGNNGLIYAVRNDGTVLSGWPQTIQTNMEGSAVIANVDTSRTYEILTGDNFTSNAHLFAFTVSGSQSPQFPVTMSGSMSVNCAAVADVDRNGTLEIALVNANGTVNLWTTTAPADSHSAEWGTFYHDNQHTGNYHFKPRGTTSVRAQYTAEIPSSTRLWPNYPNPFNPITNIKFQIPSTKLGFGISDLRFVSLKVFDVLGREVATLVDEALQPGTYETRFDGSNLGSGVYFCRLSVLPEARRDHVPTNWDGQTGGVVQAIKLLLQK